MADKERWDRPIELMIEMLSHTAWPDDHVVSPERQADRVTDGLGRRFAGVITGVEMNEIRARALTMLQAGQDSEPARASTDATVDGGIRSVLDGEALLAGARIDVPYQKLSATAHRHEYSGQALVHSHPGGDHAHGYYGHAEDAKPART